MIGCSGNPFRALSRVEESSKNLKSLLPSIVHSIGVVICPESSHPVIVNTPSFISNRNELNSLFDVFDLIIFPIVRNLANR